MKLQLNSPVKFLKGVGPKRAQQLAKFGLATVEDLLFHLPFRYEDRRRIRKLAHAVLGEECSFVGQLITVRKRYVPQRRSQILTASFKDDTAVLELVWYRAPGFLAEKILQGTSLLVHGKVERGSGGQFRMVHPDFEVFEEGEDPQLQRIVAISGLAAAAVDAKMDCLPPVIQRLSPVLSPWQRWVSCLWPAAGALTIRRWTRS